MIEFDYKKALAGHPCIARNGVKVTKVTRSPCPISGFFCLYIHYENGRYAYSTPYGGVSLDYKESEWDVFLQNDLTSPETRVISSMETETIKLGDTLVSEGGTKFLVVRMDGYAGPQGGGNYYLFDPQTDYLYIWADSLENLWREAKESKFTKIIESV